MMAEAVLNDSGRVLAASAMLTGQYGINDVYCGVPVQLDKNGIRRVIELALNDDELKALQASASNVAQGIADVKAALAS